MDRDKAYLRYLTEKGMAQRHGPEGFLDTERVGRAAHELDVICGAGFASYFIILADIMEFCRRENIPYGPGRGSVGGCYVGYLIGIHEIDSIEFDLMFERFLGADRVSYPDVDLDFSQRDRPRVLSYIQEKYSQRGNVVLQVAAFARAGGRSVIDHVLAARRAAGDVSADSTSLALRQCLPDGNITGGTKQARELKWWLEPGNGGHGKVEEFRKIATNAGWLEPMLKIDGMFTHLQKHAAGVVILAPQDLEKLPQCSADGESMMTAYDMYDLEELKFLKIDALGLRTLDVIADAHKLMGGTGATRDLMEIWKNHRDDPDPYPMLSEGDTLGIFQMETDGYRRTLRDFKPEKFEHIVHLNALYRPGALDYRRDDGKNMVEVFIDRRHHEEPPTPPAPQLEGILRETYGIFLFQEQAMKAVQILAGFDGLQADTLRKGIGKKRAEVIEKLKPKFFEGCKLTTEDQVADRVWRNIEAAGRYSWNKAHAVEYAAITWLTAWFKVPHSGEATCDIEGCPCGYVREAQAAFYAATLNSFAGDSKKAEKQAVVIAEARQRVDIAPPDINVAQDGFTTIGDKLVFGLSGIKGMGEANRDAILEGRGVIPFGSFQDFAMRLPSVPIHIKTSLIRAGAFDFIDDRQRLLSKFRKPGQGKKCTKEGAHDAFCICEGSGRIPQNWTVAEHINHNRTLKTPRPVPTDVDFEVPSQRDLSQGEVDVIGFYVSTAPLADIAQALERLPRANHFGGEVQKIYRKRDRRDGKMATVMILTPAMQRQRVVIFSSIWSKYEWLDEGDRIIIRGRLSGDDVLADAIFEPDNLVHFSKIKASRNGEPAEPEPFDGTLETVEALEAAGYTVRLL